MKFKTTILVVLIIQAVFTLFWTWGTYTNSLPMGEISRQTYSIMANIKLLLTVALYIAWRVTP